MGLSTQGVRYIDGVTGNTANSATTSTVYSYTNFGKGNDKPIQSVQATTFINGVNSFSTDNQAILGADEVQGSNYSKTFPGELSHRSYPVVSGYNASLVPQYGSGLSSVLTVINPDLSITNSNVTYTIGITPASTQII